MVNHCKYYFQCFQIFQMFYFWPPMLKFSFQWFFFFLFICAVGNWKSKLNGLIVLKRICHMGHIGTTFGLFLRGTYWHLIKPLFWHSMYILMYFCKYLGNCYSYIYLYYGFDFGYQLNVGEDPWVPSISFMDYVLISNLRVVLPKPNLAGINKNIFGR